MLTCSCRRFHYPCGSNLHGSQTSNYKYCFCVTYSRVAEVPPGVCLKRIMPSSILYSDFSCDLLATEFNEGIPMTGKRSPTNRAAAPPRTDDLKLINGIGPAVEKRLNGVGIFTFAQLAALSPADIAAAVADLAGLSAERIIKQDWIGQARKLAAGSLASEAQQDTMTAVKTPTPVEERAPAVTQQVEPQQPDKLVV